MSYYIPIFFFPANDDEVPLKLESWQTVDKLLSKKWDTRQHSGLRTTASRNWWHQDAVSLICKYLQITGLEFLQREIVCLDIPEIYNGLSAIDSLLDACQHGIPELTPEMENNGSIWSLRNYYEGYEVNKFTRMQIDEAIAEACPTLEIEGFADQGYNALVEFFSFLKTLYATFQECLSQNKKFLWVSPQP
jgi:hypothetical protein